VSNRGTALGRAPASKPFAASKLFILRGLLAALDATLGFSLARGCKFLFRKNPDERLISDSMIYNTTDFSLSMSKISARIMQRLGGWSNIVKQRRSNYRFLLSRLSSLCSGRPLFGDLPEDACPLNFPVVVKNRDALFDSLRGEGIPCYIWPDLPPDVSHSLKYYPNTKVMAERLICLSLHQDLKPKHLEHIANVVHRNAA